MTSNKGDYQRMFLVGCPRSGTTLLQSMIAAHSNVVSFPETHLFTETIYFARHLRPFQYYGLRERRLAFKQIKKIGGEYAGLEKDLKLTFMIRNWVQQLLLVLDKAANQLKPNGNITHWLEKTPRHLHYLNEVQKADRNAKYIHLIRRGEEVVVSMHEASKQNPEMWGGVRDLEKCIFWWNESILESKKYLGHHNHIFVLYDDLIEQPERTLEYLCGQCGLVYEKDMLQEFQQEAKILIEQEETWKQRNLNDTMSKSRKFDNYSNEDQILIKKGIVEFDYDMIRL